jgi:hypothetical protein
VSTSLFADGACLYRKRFCQVIRKYAAIGYTRLEKLFCNKASVPDKLLRVGMILHAM